MYYLLPLLLCAPLGVCSIKRRHQSPEWTILSHVDCFIQGEVIRFQVLLDCLRPRNTMVFWWSPPVLQGEAVKIFLASVTSGIHSWINLKHSINVKFQYLCNICVINWTLQHLCIGHTPTKPLATFIFHRVPKHSDAQPRESECPDVKNYKWRLNPVWHRMLYSCAHMATVGVKELNIHHRFSWADLTRAGTLPSNCREAADPRPRRHGSSQSFAD